MSDNAKPDRSGTERPEANRADSDCADSRHAEARDPVTDCMASGINIGPGTLSVWSGSGGERFKNATQPPIVQSVSFAYDNLADWTEVATGRKDGHIYGRNSNPTVQILEEKIRILENAEGATSFATGMAAISNTLFALTLPGSRVVTQKDTYGGTSKLFLDFLPRFGIHVELCETTEITQFERAISSGCDVVYIESPTNPTLKIVDIALLSEMAHRAGAIVVVDNTLATPINQNPLALGADLVLHSATKFLGGHSDALGGLLAGRADLVERVFRYREINGATLGPMAAYLIIRGMKTLELRIKRQNHNAVEIANFLAGHPGISEVHYPGLESHPGHETARRQMRGYGGVLSFVLSGAPSRAAPFLESLRWVHLAAHLGGVETIAGPPRTTSHVELTREERASLGISENLIRYSVGIENSEDLILDLSQALECSL